MHFGSPSLCLGSQPERLGTITLQHWTDRNHSYFMIDYFKAYQYLCIAQISLYLWIQLKLINPPSTTDGSEPLRMCVTLSPAVAAFPPYFFIHDRHRALISTQSMHQGVWANKQYQVTSFPPIMWQHASQPSHHVTHWHAITSKLCAGVSRLVWPRLAYYVLSHLFMPFCITHWELDTD